MNDIETIQRARGWRECPDHNGFWLSPHDPNRCTHALPDPLADTSEGWWEFGQILRWAHEPAWRLAVEPYHDGTYGASVFRWTDLGGLRRIAEVEHPDFRAAIVAALAAAVRREREEPNG